MVTFRENGDILAKFGYRYLYFTKNGRPLGELGFETHSARAKRKDKARKKQRRRLRNLERNDSRALPAPASGGGRVDAADNDARDAK